MKVVVMAAVFGLLAAPVFAQPGGMSGVIIEREKEKGMKGDTTGTGMESPSEPAKGPHRAVGVVKKVDRKASTVTIAHEPVKSMNWPAMNMTFQVKDKSMLDKLRAGKKVEVEFDQRGKDYVITSAK
jgi:Cu(I)/Ag(I) efflux system periplasmic protein CusF